MQKVTTINLGGQAYQLEEAGYKTLQAYLDSAASTLMHDPDREEIMQDLEQAVAAKCDQYVSGDKNVVMTREVEEIIAAMGPVEAAESDDNEAQTSTAAPKRFYRVRENALIGGVCTGLSAYFNVDVTVVRLVFILLAFLTGGFWILFYIIMMIIVPEAKTPEQMAAVRGEKFSAQDLMERAKQKYAEVSDKEQWQRLASDTAPALNKLGEIISIFVRGCALIIAILAAVAIAWATVALASLLWALVFGHLQFHDQLSTISHVGIGVGLAAMYLVFVIPLVFIAMAFRQAGGRRSSSKRSGALAITGGVIWAVALSLLTVLAVVNGGRIGDYANTHGYIDFGNHRRYCINYDICHNVPTKQVIETTPAPVPQPGPMMVPSTPY